MTTDRFATLETVHSGNHFNEAQPNGIPVTCSKSEEIPQYKTVIVWDEKWNPVEIKVKAILA